MGIRRLNKFLNDKGLIKTYPNINSYVAQHRKYGRKAVIAIDFWLYANKFSHSCDGHIIIGFWNQIIKLLSYRIIPIYVIDGSIPIEKEDIIISRKKRYENNIKKINEIENQISKFIDLSELTQKTDQVLLDTLQNKKTKLQKNIKKISKKELRDTFELFNLLGISYIRAKYEADALCAKLFEKDIIISCLSDDMDMLALGCKSTIKFIDGKLIEYNLENILKELDITHDQFIDMCILFGCDYLKHPIKIDCFEIYNLIVEYGSFEGILEKANHEIFRVDNSKCRILCEKYYDVKEVYLNSKNLENFDELNLIEICMDEINIDDINNFLESKNFFDSSEKSKNCIIRSLNYINNHIKKNII